MKKLLIGILLGIACATAHAGAGWSTEQLLDRYGSPDQTTVTHFAMGDYDYGVCDVYHWNDSDHDAYVLRNDWRGWKAGTVCYEIQLVDNPDPSDGAYGAISQYIFAPDSIYEMVFLPSTKHKPTQTHRVIHVHSESDQKAHKDTDDLQKFEEKTEKQLHREPETSQKSQDIQDLNMEDLKKFEEQTEKWMKEH